MGEVVCAQLQRLHSGFLALGRVRVAREQRAQPGHQVELDAAALAPVSGQRSDELAERARGGLTTARHTRATVSSGRRAARVLGAVGRVLGAC
jgi:hypothetical protein